MMASAAAFFINKLAMLPKCLGKKHGYYKVIYQ